MIVRNAEIKDIDQIMKIRLQVRENVLSDPSKVTEQMCIDYLEKKGCGWVCEKNSLVVGFSYAAIEDNSIWALFVLPKYESQGLGTLLLKAACDWLFSQGADKVKLETGAKTRADKFYQAQGWQRSEENESGDVEFTFFKEVHLIRT